MNVSEADQKKVALELTDKKIYEDKFFSINNIKTWAKIFKENMDKGFNKAYNAVIESIKKDTNVSFGKILIVGFLILVWVYMKTKQGTKKVKDLLSFPAFTYFYDIFSKFMGKTDTKEKVEIKQTIQEKVLDKEEMREKIKNIAGGNFYATRWGIFNSTSEKKRIEFSYKNLDNIKNADNPIFFKDMVRSNSITADIYLFNELGINDEKNEIKLIEHFLYEFNKEFYKDSYTLNKFEIYLEVSNDGKVCLWVDNIIARKFIAEDKKEKLINRTPFNIIFNGKYEEIDKEYSERCKIISNNFSNQFKHLDTYYYKEFTFNKKDVGFMVDMVKFSNHYMYNWKYLRNEFYDISKNICYRCDLVTLLKCEEYIFVVSGEDDHIYRFNMNPMGAVYYKIITFIDAETKKILNFSEVYDILIEKVNLLKKC